MIKPEELYNLFNELVEDKVKSLTEEKEKLESILVFNQLEGLDNDVTFEKEQVENISTYLLCIEDTKKEIKNIKNIDASVPDDIKELLSPYGTFYDGTGTLYCTQESDIEQLLFCTINHIAHYMLGLFCTTKKGEIGFIARFMSTLGIVKCYDPEGWDYSSTIIHYFTRIYKESFQNVILFESCSNYKKHMMNLINNDQYPFAKKIRKDSSQPVSQYNVQHCMILYREITRSCINLIVVPVALKPKQKTIYYTVKNKSYKMDSKSHWKFYNPPQFRQDYYDLLCELGFQFTFSLEDI